MDPEGNREARDSGSLSEDPRWSSLGADDATVEIVSYRSAWPGAFRDERKRLLDACGTALVTVEHIGSTSVPGLPAKPILDLMPGIQTPDDGERIIGPMTTLGYEYWGEYGIPGRFFFVLRSARRRWVNAHAFPVRHAEWVRHLCFRDYLREHPQTRQDYADLKYRIGRRFAKDLGAYTDAKTEFIQWVEALAGAPRQKE